jgi:hypothetical protein
MSLPTAVDHVYSNIKSSIDHKSFTAADSMSLVATLMQLAEAYKSASAESLSGPNKRRLVLTVLDRFVNDLPIEADTKKQLQYFASVIAPAAVDIIIGASKSDLALNAKKKCLSMPCFGRK